MQQGGERRWNQSRRRSKHEVFGTDDHDLHFFVFIYLFIFFLAGIILFAIGAMPVVEQHSLEYIDFFGKNYEAMVLATIVVGGSIILASILGVVSVFQNTKGMIYWFQLAMIFLMLAQAVLALQGFFHLMAYRTGLERRLQTSFGNTSWHKMQSTFKCCGVYDSDEWVELEGKVPSSCCSLSSSDQCQKLHDSGCFAALSTWYKQDIGVISGLSLAFFLLECFGLFFISIKG